MTFTLLDPKRAQDAEALARRAPPPVFRNLEESAPSYRPSDELAAAVNVALALSAPLLVTGEPGTGKTQIAWFLRHYFDLPRDAIFVLDVKSTTVAQDLTARFDPVRYFHAANDPRHHGKDLDRGEYIDYGPLYHAYKAPGGRAIVLIDEIDKAPRDFPNDLLAILDQRSFTVPETKEEVRAPEVPPILVITSNSERRLPEPFLRRCVFHHIKLTNELVDRALEAHAGAWRGLPADVVRAARARFQALRNASLALRKPPGMAELLSWLSTLQSMGFTDAEALQTAPLSRLPALSTLVKDSDDLGRLG